MTSQWVMDEMKTVDLRDKRLERRLAGLLDTLSEASSASIPAACHDRAEMVAAYRFLDNNKVDFADVLSPHIDAAYERVNGQKVALLIQNTTELDLTRATAEVDGAGPLQNGRRVAALFHLLHTFTTDGTLLGTLSAEAWTRGSVTNKPKSKRGFSARRMEATRKPFEEKETFRWLQAAEHCQDVKQHCADTQSVMLADRESDITEVIDDCTSQHQLDWVIRADGDRVLNKQNKAETSIHAHDYLSHTKPLYRDSLSIRARLSWGSESVKHRPGKADREARNVKVTVHSGEITLNDPRVGKREGVTVNAVQVREAKPTPEAEPIEWMLLISLPVATREQVELIIRYYLTRWMIELFFKTLKSGCRIESRRFEHIDRFLPSLALYMIIALRSLLSGEACCLAKPVVWRSLLSGEACCLAKSVVWRSLYVCRVSRACAEKSCGLVYTAAEWQSVWSIVRRSPPPKRPPQLLEMTKLITELGGYIKLRRSKPPGPQSMWPGLQQMHPIATCWLTFGPGATKSYV